MAEEEDNRSVEDIAREAMEAIKKAQKMDDERREREEREFAEAKEAALKEEVKRKLRKKMERLEKEEAKKPKEDVPDPRFMVSWKSGDDGKGYYYEGEYNDKLSFTIKRGLNLYHLYVVNNDLMIEAWQKSTCTSIDLFTLKQKADKILGEAIKRAEAKKKLEEEKKKQDEKGRSN